MKIRRSLLLLICLLTIMSCTKKPDMRVSAEMECVVPSSTENEPPPPPPAPDEPSSEIYDTKLVKKGDLTISSTDIETTKKLIYGFVKVCNGNVTNENLVAKNQNSYYLLSFNIQASYFDKFVHLLDSSKLNIVERRFSVEDVTMQYVDNTTRLENKRKLEKRYLDILSKAKNVKDILEIEKKLEDVRSDIESKENQLKVINRKIAYSEIQLRINKQTAEASIDNSNAYSNRIVQGLINGWEGFTSFLIVLISAWPLYLLIAIVYLVVRIIIKRRKKKRLHTDHK